MIDFTDKAEERKNRPSSKDKKRSRLQALKGKEVTVIDGARQSYSGTLDYDEGLQGRNKGFYLGDTQIRVGDVHKIKDGERGRTLELYDTIIIHEDTGTRTVYDLIKEQKS